MAAIKPNYLELKAGDIGAAKSFYADALGFAFTDYGPEYAAVEGGPVQIGFAAGDEPPAPLPAFESDALETTLAAVVAAGANIVKPIFEYPGGRRFHFIDPAGNEIAIYQPD